MCLVNVHEIVLLLRNNVLFFSMNKETLIVSLIYHVLHNTVTQLLVFIYMSIYVYMILTFCSFVYRYIYINKNEYIEC